MLKPDFIKALQEYANGDGSKDYAITRKNNLIAVSRALERRYQFEDTVKQYGKPAVALCLAATMSTQHGYEPAQKAWAHEVLSIWTNRHPAGIKNATVELHPAILSNISKDFRADTKLLRFADILQQYPSFEADLIVGGEDMPCTLVWDVSQVHLTNYGEDRFGELLHSPAQILNNGNLEIFCDNADLGKQFVWAASGHIALSEYNRIFEEVEPEQEEWEP